MVYSEIIEKITKLNSENAIILFTWMCLHAEYNTNNVYLATNIRKQIQQELNMSNNTITNSLKKLKDNNLISGKDGVFTMNPKFVWRGDSRIRELVVLAWNKE